METLRRVAAHEVVLPSGEILHQAVVEIDEYRVVNYYEFREELPLCEWLGGTIEIVDTKHGLIAFQEGKKICTQ